MTRRLSLLSVTLLACLTLPMSAQAAFKTGISDQVPGSFLNPLFSGLKASAARYIAPFDVMTLPADNANRVALDEWIRNARAAHQDVLVSFEHSHTPGKEKTAPSAATFRKDLLLFMKAYPAVKSLSPWNEVNRCNRTVAGSSLVVGQPRKLCSLSTGPKLAASYYKATRSACSSLHRSCKIVALDILDQNSVTQAVRYTKAFRRFAKPAPKIWGIHNYSDTNRFSNKRTKALLNATGRGEVWLTETGGIVKFGTSFPFSESRAAKALGCMFTIAKSSPRIKRLYIYNFTAAQPGSDFDSGLVNTNGTKRPGWTVVQKRKAGVCKK
jgi:hypothetical protein